MSRIVGGGFYGMKNYGDDLFGIVSARAASEFWSDDQFQLMCPPIDGLDAEYSVPGWFPINIFSSLSPAGKAARLAFLLRSLSQADRYVFCGGSVFSSSESGARNIIDRLSRRGLALSAVGVSIGPFADIASEKKIESLLQRFEYLSLRDKISYDIAKSFSLECPVVMAGDLAGLMPRYYPLAAENKVIGTSAAKKIAFSPCNLIDGFEMAKEYCDEFVSAIVAIKDDVPLNILILNLNDHVSQGDRELCEYVRLRLKQGFDIDVEVLDYSKMGVLGVWRIISVVDYYVSVRLHGAITAFMLNVPFSLFEYHTKCSDFLDDLGVNAQCRLVEGGSGLESAIRNSFMRREDLTRAIGKFSTDSVKNFSQAPWAAGRI